MTKPLRVLFFYTALIILAVVLATAQTIRTELAANKSYTETSTVVDLDENPWTVTNVDLEPRSGTFISAEGY